MQIYADVIGQPMLIAGSPQTPALGSAVSAAVTAGAAAGGYASWTEAQDRMTSMKEKRFEPRAGRAGDYDELYAHLSRASRRVRRRGRRAARSGRR